MDNILKKIAEKRLADVSEAKKEYDYPFYNALRKPGMNFICEVKKASPSKGVIADYFPYLKIAMEYEAAGAAAISVLTEPHYFMGSLDYLREIAQRVSIPVLRKDFIVDESMIVEAKEAGAAAVLLIVALLDKEKLKNYLHLVHSIGLSALVEAHDAEEVKTAVEVGAKIIGVNNRDLRDFSIDMNNSISLRKLVEDDSVVFVSESGIKTAEDIKKLSDGNIHAVLIGETLMRSEDKREALRTLRGE